MANYVIAYAVLRGPPDTVVYRSSTYRLDFWYACKGERSFTAERGHPFIDDLDLPQTARVTTAARYLELAEAYRQEFDAEYPDEGPMYADAMTRWLVARGPSVGVEIVLVQEL